MTSRHLVTLIVALGALALAMLTLLGQLTWTAYQESIHAAQTRTADYAAILNTQLDTSLRRVDANLRQLVRSTPVAALDQKAVSRYVSGLGAEWRSSLIDFPELRSLSIFDANGDLLYSTNADLERLNISDRGHFRALRGNPQAEVAFSEVVIARLSGWATVSVARALRNDKGVFLGIAVATLDLSYLEKIFQTLAVGAGGNVALYRSDDFTLVLRQPRLEGRLNIPLPPDSPTRAALAAGNKMVSIIFTAASDGRERIYSYHVLERFPFFVSVGVAKDEVLASWRVRSLAVGLSAVLFFGVIIGLLVRLWRTEVGRTRAIAEALEAGDRMAAIVENSRDAIISRGADYKITTWNNAAERLFGYSAAEAIGQDSGMLTPPERLEATLYNRNLLEQGQGLLDIETVRLTKGGQRIDVSMRLSTIRAADGAVLAVSMVFRDIGARKHLEAVHQSLEEQLRESQKMQAIGTLAGGIAHDFNNILAAILGNADLMRQDLTANPEAMESLEEICKASRRGRDLVQQILAFSRRQPVELKPMALAPLVEESARLLRSTLPARVILQTQFGADLPDVLASATQIQQVIINLSTNAMQAMGGLPGRIDISLDTVVLDDTLAEANPALHAMLEIHPGRTARLVVKDTGPGMDSNTLSRIFEPFFTTKAVNEGTGLGLSVVHGIVHAHQGVIMAGSEVGQGTTFTIYLPLAPAESVAKIPDMPGGQFDAANELNLDGGKHVLYLDDDQFLVSLVKRLLERRGLRVSAYLDPGEALAVLRANPASFDLVVSDYNMPGMSGLEVAREVRAIRADLPVVVASGFVDETLQTQAKAAGVREVILKAEAMDGFCEVIARVLNEVGNKSKTS